LFAKRLPLAVNVFIEPFFVDFKTFNFPVTQSFLKNRKPISLPKWISSENPLLL